MRIIAKSTIKEFWHYYPNAEHALLDWYNVTKKADWNNPNDVKKTYGNASVLFKKR